MARLDLKNYIISEMQSSIPDDQVVSAESMHDAIARAITKYLTSHVTVDVESNNSIYTYKYTWKVTGSLTSIPVPSDFSEWLGSISSLIRSSFYLMSDSNNGSYDDEGNYIYVYPLGNQSAFPTCTISLSQSELTEYHEANYESPYEGLMNILADSICNALLVSGNQDIEPSNVYYSNFKVTNVNL